MQVFELDLRNGGPDIDIIGSYRSNNSDSAYKHVRYIQIKRQIFKSNIKRYQQLQLIDISDQIMMKMAQGEKKLLALINATVSHEMRNPINSIQSQTIRQK